MEGPLRHLPVRRGLPGDRQCRRAAQGRGRGVELADRAQGGANSKNVKLKFLGNQDPGAFVSTSGAGVLASSKRQAQAQQFVAFLTSVAGQQAIVGSGTMEYPIASDVAANPALTPLSQLGAPPVDPTALNGPRVVELMRQAGLS